MRIISKLGFTFTKQQLWEFFLIIAFPIHFWALILWFQEFETMAERSNMWDAFGVGSYFMAYALFESATIFAGISLIMLLLPKQLDKKVTFIVIAVLYLVIAGWFILEQTRFLAIIPEDVWFFKRIQNLKSIKSKAGAATAIIFALSFILPLIFLLKSKKLQDKILSFLNRLTVLSILYLVFDFLAILVIIIRNV
jgi:hypothetical protein